MGVRHSAARSVDRTASTQQPGDWRSRGWLQLPGIWPEDVIAKCAGEAARRFARASTQGSARFPFQHAYLDAVTLHRPLLSVAAQLLGSGSDEDAISETEIRLAMSELKFPPASLQSGETRHCLVPCRAEPDAVMVLLAYENIDILIGQSDTGSGGVVQRQMAGAALLLRLDVEFQVLNAKMPMHHMVFRKACAEWVQGDVYVRRLARTDVILKADPVQRSVLGFPAPGHEHWSSVANMQRAKWRYESRYHRVDGEQVFDVEPYLPPGMTLREFKALPLMSDGRSFPEPPTGAHTVHPEDTYSDVARLVLPEGANGPDAAPLSNEQVTEWNDNGALHVNKIWDNDLITEALLQAERNKFMKFPSHAHAINRIALHPRELAAVSQLLRVPVSSVRLMQAMVASKKGPGENQGMHTDFHNNSLLTPARCQETWLEKPEDVAMILYLNDHDLVGGGTCWVPGLRHSSSLVGRHRPDFQSRSKLLQPLDRLYQLERRPAYKAGSALIYSLGTWHRGTPVVAGQERYVMFLSFRAASAEWLGGDPGVGHPTATEFAALEGFSKDGFLAGLTPEQRAVLGFPAVDSEYWSAATIAELRRRCTAFDVKPYVQALEQRSK